MKGRLVVHISAADVGSRVSVRSQLDGDPGGPTMTDTVGRLLSWHDGTLVIQRRDGTVADVAERDLLAGKVVPETPPRRKDS